ncbi:MAG TPA: endo alpha-1,4 polygalactosaminidase, partial [Pilimelia sp.]|nr:endo alpha-1,4 polygalactosaminidase [Pilimelia sp.]
MKSPKHAPSSTARYRWLVALAALVVLAPAGIAVAVYSARTAAPGTDRPESAGPWAGESPRFPVSPSLRPTERPTPSATASRRPSQAPSASHGPTRPRTPGGPGRWWRPAPGTTWQWHIVGEVREPFADVTMYDIDLTDAVPRDMTVRVPGFGAVRWPKGRNAGVVDRLHAAGKVVICYLDTGAYETYEPDAALFPGRAGFSGSDSASDVIGNDTGWDGEYWLDIRRSQWHRFAPIMWARFDLAKAIGCDGVE